MAGLVASRAPSVLQRQRWRWGREQPVMSTMWCWRMEIEKTNKRRSMRIWMIWIDGTIQIPGFFLRLSNIIQLSTCSRSSRNGLKIAWRSWLHCMRHNSWRLSELSWKFWDAIFLEGEKPWVSHEKSRCFTIFSWRFMIHEIHKMSEIIWDHLNRRPCRGIGSAWCGTVISPARLGFGWTAPKSGR